MLALSWVAALARRRPSRLAGAVVGVAIAVALLGSLGSFLAAAKRDMTRRAASQVAVDWQVEVQPGGSPSDVLAALHRRGDVRLALPVGFGAASSFEATTGESTQTTGPGAVLGLPVGYRSAFPGELRPLTGAGDGVLVAQQTAANLHTGPGDTLTIQLPGPRTVALRVDGVVDLPAADSLFQRVGAPVGAQRLAPPDNVVIVPLDRWHEWYDPLEGRSEAGRTQFHVRLDHRLPNDPAAAFTRAAGAGRRLEADVAGTALVGNNLAATLDAARSDALYAEVLFVLLGLPGAFLAALLTRAVAAATGEARRRELALLRTRGATLAQLQRVVTAEAAAIGIAGAGLGLVLARTIGQIAYGSSTFGATTSSAAFWAVCSALAGLLITVVAVAVPARRDAAATSVASSRRSVGRPTVPRVLRYGVDLLVLAGAALVFWATSRGHYNLVLAPEGVATVSIDYWALAGPLLLWVGIGLFSWRVIEAVLGRGGRVLRAVLRPFAGRLSGPAASSLRRQRRRLATAVVLVALTTSFAISTAVFNTTYRHQVEADALLTNGAAVTVTEQPSIGAPPTERQRVARVWGVSHVEALQHRFVYIGADLQDVFGVDPTTIGVAGRLQDSYFAGDSARGLMARLAAQRDAALFSAETVRDFQLQLGDRVHTRIRDARSGNLIDVTFRYAGVVKEFPTAPTDSFVVANAAFIASQTGDPSVSTLLVSTHGTAPRVVASRVRPVVSGGATVSDIETSRRVVGSSLTAVNLAGLTKVELAFALLLVAAATGLVLGLGLAERRRTFAIASALGARPRQLAVFARTEAAVFVLLGGGLGIAGGWTLARMLVKVLTGVFDPAPVGLSVPWRYLGSVALSAGVALTVAIAAQRRSLRRPLAEIVRDL